MGQIRLREEAVTPDAPSEGVTLFSTVATPSILKLRDDAGNVYTLALVDKAQTISGANTFTTVQTVAPGTIGANGLTVNMPSSTTAYALQILYNSIEAMRLQALATDHSVQLAAFDNGNSIGPYITLGRNSNASTPASAFIIIQDKNSNANRIWVDGSGNLRIGTSNPTNANDLAGTVVGTQTSSRAFKNILGAATNPAQALKNIVEAGRRALRRFTYKSGAYNNQAFEGIIVEEAPRYGMDRDAEHPAGKSLNEITLLSDLVGAIVALTERLEALESKQNG